MHEIRFVSFALLATCVHAFVGGKGLLRPLASSAGKTPLRRAFDHPHTQSSLRAARKLKEEHEEPRQPTIKEQRTMQKIEALRLDQIDVAVVGGGIGGLALALALTKRGFRCRVFEKDPAFGEA